MSFNLYSLGLNWHKTGQIKRGRHIVAYLFFSDVISLDLRHKIKASIPQAYFLNSHAQYAPEQKSSVVAIPSDAELMRQRKTA